MFPPFIIFYTIMLCMIVSFVSHVCTVPYTSENMNRFKPEPVRRPNQYGSRSFLVYFPILFPLAWTVRERNANATKSTTLTPTAL